MTLFASGVASNFTHAFRQRSIRDVSYYDPIKHKLEKNFYREENKYEITFAKCVSNDDSFVFSFSLILCQPTEEILTLRLVRFAPLYLKRAAWMRKSCTAFSSGTRYKMAFSRAVISPRLCERSASAQPRAFVSRNRSSVASGR